MTSLTLQIFNNTQQQWLDMALLHFPLASQNDFSKIKVEYLQSYVVEYFGSQNSQAISINYPVDFFLDVSADERYCFLDDIIPSGASRRYWLKHLDIAHLSESQQNYILLKQATIAPVGNLRIKESVQQLEQQNKRTFPIQDVVERATDFLEFAQQNGAVSGGATGAGGEAPKMLLRMDKEQVWIDSFQTEISTDQYYLVKYPRNQRTTLDCDILRAEYHYYQELTAMGFNTIDAQNMRLIEGKKYPSLWLPRFDIQVQNNKIKRYAMESVYAMLKKGAGSHLKHEQTLKQLIEIIQQSQFSSNFDVENFVIQWVQRDLLNIAFGNTDNHGRNTAFLRDENELRLAPIYDFAPMKADSEAVIRTMQWSAPLELGGQFRFDLIAEQLKDWVMPEKLIQELQVTAKKLLDLEMRLKQRGVTKDILEIIQIKYLPHKLEQWGLLK